MPAYDFECPDGHLFETFLMLAEYKDEIPCQREGCTKTARRQYLPAGYVAQGFQPIVVHRGVDGKIRIPGSPDAPVAEGFTKVELRTLGEVRAVEREMDRSARFDHESSQERREQMVSQARKERRAALMDQLKTQFGRDFARHAMEQSDARRRSGYEPGAYFDVFQNDRSNRSEHSDQSTGWRGRKA